MGELKKTPILYDRRVMGCYAGLGPTLGMVKVIEVCGDRARATIRADKGRSHPDPEVKLWWENIYLTLTNDWAYESTLTRAAAMLADNRLPTLEELKS